MSHHPEEVDRKSDVEGISVNHIEEKAQAEEEFEEIIAAEDQFTPQEYKKLMLKVDLIMMPLLMFTYGLQYSDKTSLASGTVFHLREDTGLVGQQYNTLTVWFYMAYAVAQFPMGYVMQRFPLGKALGVSIVLWGTMVILLGACNNYWQLSIVRTLLGWFEAVVTPGFAVLTASWYLRKEQSLRQGMYYAMNSFFGIVFSVAIYFLADFTQRQGKISAWRVINYFLGGLTVTVGFVCLAIIGTPDEVWWLSKREKLMAKARVVSNSTGGGEQHPWKWSQVRECFRDPQFYMAILFNFLSNVPNGGMTTFNTLILHGMGFDALGSILYNMPAGAVAFCTVITSSILVRYFEKVRFHLAWIYQLIAVIVFLFVGLSAGKVGNWQRWGVFCLYPFYAVVMFMIWPLMSVNIAGRTKKTFFAAAALFSYCIGNIVGSLIFVQSDAPRYAKGITGCAIAMCLNIVNILVWWLYYRWVNRKRERAWLASGQSAEQREHDRKLAGEHDLTDMENQHFRYSC